MHDNIKIDLQETIERCKALGIETIMLEDSNSDYTGEHESCWLIEDLLDFCVKNNAKTVYIEPIRFDYEDFCREVENKYNKKSVLDFFFNKEMDFLRKEFPNINEGKMRQVLDDVTEDFICNLYYALDKLRPMDGEAIDYNYKAYSHDQCMKCDWSERVALIGYRDKFSNTLLAYRRELIIIMEQLAYTPMYEHISSNPCIRTRSFVLFN